MNRNLAITAASLLTWGLGEGLFLYFQTIYLQQLGASPLLIGGILGGMGVAMVIAQLPAGYLADRIGPRPIMWGSWILGTAAAWMMALAHTLPFFIVGLIAYGLTSFVLAPMNSYITSVRGKWSPGRALSLVSAAYNLGAVAGPLIGGVIAKSMGLRSVYQFSAVILIVSTIIILMAGKPPAEVHEHHASDRHVFNNKPLLTLVGLTFFTMLVLYMPQPLTANYLQSERGLSIEQIGILGSLASLGNVTIMLALGSLKAPIGFLVGQPLVALFSIFMWRGTGMTWFGMGYFVMGGYRLSRSMVLAMARSLIPPQQTGLAYGLLETANASAVILAPVIAGWLFTLQPIRMYTTALLGIAVIFLLNLLVLPGSVLKHAAPEEVYIPGSGEAV